MLLKIKKIFKKWFSKRFVHPEINKQLSSAIDDKIAARIKLQEAETKIHTDTLNSYLKTYFSKQYESPELMKLAYDLTNKKWLKLVREVNGKSKLINLNKNAFENQVKLVIKKIKENGTNNK